MAIREFDEAQRRAIASQVLDGPKVSNGFIASSAFKEGQMGSGIGSSYRYLVPANTPCEVQFEGGEWRPFVTTKDLDLDAAFDDKWILLERLQHLELQHRNKHRCWRLRVDRERVQIQGAWLRAFTRQE